MTVCTKIKFGPRHIRCPSCCQWLIKFDYNSRKPVTVNGRKIKRRAFLIRPEHIGIQGPSVRIRLSDLGRVFVLEECLEDGNLIDVILDPKTHPKQWYSYGGCKLGSVGLEIYRRHK